MSARPVLVTAFGPFPGVEVNPTQRVLELVRAQWDEAQSGRGRAPFDSGGALSDRSGAHSGLGRSHDHSEAWSNSGREHPDRGEAHPDHGESRDNGGAHPGGGRTHSDSDEAQSDHGGAYPDAGESHRGHHTHPRPLVGEVLEVAFGSVPGRVRSLILEHRPALTVCMGVDARLAGGTSADARLASRAPAEASPTDVGPANAALTDRNLADRHPTDGYLAPGSPAHMALEATAFNEFGEGAVDVRGDTASGPVVPGGPAMWASPFRVDEAVAVLRAAGLPIERSDDAGRYLCNAALAVACDTVGALPGASAVFLHIPPAEALDPQVTAQAVLALASEESWWRHP